jgi:predicted glutamine amidotransferase
MCGIAGYNASDDVVEKYLKDKPEVMKDVLRKAWLHNLHRGYDACGYMGFQIDHNTDWFKATGTAVDSLIEEVDDDKYILEPMTVFGAHTRAATDGDPKHNKNNHPVSYKNWLVTHNGQISNFTVLRNKLVPESEKKAWPEVDSSIIPLLLEQNMDTPYDAQGLYDAMRELRGAFAFHAIHQNYPGVSIFVRGTGRPFTIANLHKQLFAYGSEPESVWSMIRTMGIDPNKGFDWITLDTEHFLIVERGEIIDYGSFRTDYSSNKKQIGRRWLPRESGRKRTLVYEDDNDYVFANKTAHHSIKGNEDKAKLIYTRQGGFGNSKMAFPAANEATSHVPMSEADAIYAMDNFWHGFFGNIEVVMADNGRILKDVFNHNLPFKMTQRFEIRKKKSIFKNGIPARGLSLQDFMRLRTTDIKEVDIPLEESEYQYVTDQRKLQEEEDKKTAPFTGQLPRSTTTPSEDTLGFTCDDESMDEVDDETWIPEIITPGEKLTWGTVFAEAVPHQWEPLFFLQDRVCPTHKQVFSQHTHPETCQVVLYAASYAFAACENMDLYNAFEYTYPLDYATDNNYCNDNKEDKEGCDWIPAELIKITNTYTSWYVRVSEQCKKCGAYRSLKKDPVWFELIEASDRMSIIPTGASYAN